jgi:hypothetical protein
MVRISGKVQIREAVCCVLLNYYYYYYLLQLGFHPVAVFSFFLIYFKSVTFCASAFQDIACNPVVPRILHLASLSLTRI